jgi:hypothetical protein
MSEMVWFAVGVLYANAVWLVLFLVTRATRRKP